MDIPYEILQMIYDLLMVRDALKLSLVCKFTYLYAPKDLLMHARKFSQSAAMISNIKYITDIFNSYNHSYYVSARVSDAWKVIYTYSKDYLSFTLVIRRINGIHYDRILYRENKSSIPSLWQRDTYSSEDISCLLANYPRKLEILSMLELS